MSKLEVRPFETADVPAAGVLLAERHRRHREVQPLLAARYEDVDIAAVEVGAALAVEHASGAVASRDGQLVGFLLGAPKSGDAWGPNVWVEAAGQAVTEPEVMRDLYAVAATRWVDEGRKAQYVLVPASEVDLVRAWFRLGFGHQHSHALRALPTQPPATVAGITVRRAGRADIPVLAQLELELPLHQALAPTFSAATVPSLDEVRSEWESDVDSPEYATFVAVRLGDVIGSAVGCALEKSSSHNGLARPDNTGFLGFAAVFPPARGSGAGRALGEAVLQWAAANGFDSVATDWRVTNLLSSRAWPALGFTESFVRLHRLIGY
jgi:GNAT superfamily N-acetyltransferase